MKPFTIISLLILVLFLSCSETEPALLTMTVTLLPDDTPEEDSIFLSGNFNDWDPADPAFMLSDNSSGEPEISFDAPEGTLEYKFTRGSWETVEGGPIGEDIPNRSLVYKGGGGSIEVKIQSWRDLAFDPGTAAENVMILDEDFEMPQLDRTRRIWIYLPPDYDENSIDYPVLYMHDGQNLFNRKTSFVGEWEVDESLNRLFDAGDPGCIVVGIDHGGTSRLDEYSPWVNEEYGGGEGDEYVAFLVNTLKPYIDANFRTLPGREYTGIMGSSMGGLISLYASVEYQDVFSKAGIFSPSLWFSEEAFMHVEESGKQQDMRFFIMGGEREGEFLIAAMDSLVSTLKSVGFTDPEIKLQVDSDGEHTESYWRREFPDAYLWMYRNP